jgi:hypothetical protein
MKMFTNAIKAKKQRNVVIVMMMILWIFAHFDEGDIFMLGVVSSYHSWRLG